MLQEQKLTSNQDFGDIPTEHGSFLLFKRAPFLLQMAPTCPFSFITEGSNMQNINLLILSKLKKNTKLYSI